MQCALDASPPKINLGIQAPPITWLHQIWWSFTSSMMDGMRGQNEVFMGDFQGGYHPANTR